MPLERLWHAVFGGPRQELVKARRDEAERRVVGAFAYEQADLLRDARLTREEAVAAIAERFPRLSREQVEQALARGLFESMW
ncbi:MAG TPA: hypothetical protein VF462_07885 [Micromonosporaceae bacterium]